MRYMRYTQSEKMEIIRIVEESELGVNRTLKELGIHKASSGIPTTKKFPFGRTFNFETNEWELDKKKKRVLNG